MFSCLKTTTIFFPSLKRNKKNRRVVKDEEAAQSGLVNADASVNL